MLDPDYGEHMCQRIRGQVTGCLTQIKGTHMSKNKGPGNRMLDPD